MTITVHAYPHPLTDECLTAECEPGQTIAEIAGTNAIVATVNGKTVPAHLIDRARLKSGELVIRAVPEAAIGAAIAAIGVAAASVIGAGAVPASILGSATLATAASVGVAGAISICGPMTINRTQL